MHSIGLELIAIILLIGVNGFFALSELAVLTARKHALKRQAEEGNRRARLVVRLQADMDRFLSSIQIGITMVGILAGVFSGATMASKFAMVFARLDWLEPYARSLSIGIIVAVITFLTLLFGELVPKRIALAAPERTAKGVAPAIALVAAIFKPAVSVLTACVVACIRILGLHHVPARPISDEDIKSLVEEARLHGVFEDEERDMIYRVIRFGDRSVSSLMTPAVDVAVIDPNDEPDRILAVIHAGNFSHYPLAKRDFSRMYGVIHVKRILHAMREQWPLPLRELADEPIVVKKESRALELLRIFKREGESMALVVDAGGNVVGIVTIKDILEALVGEIREPGEAPALVRREAKGFWVFEGRALLEDVFEMLGVPPPTDHRFNRVKTLSGLVQAYQDDVSNLEKPFRIHGVEFEIISRKGVQIQRIRARAIHDDTESKEASSDEGAEEIGGSH
ncbi:hemolysin family protein [Desulfovibrio inopinatus]|uniref:hemolysin family protein n=1 Tax=Desulfovibrio inopinatus TaxID=102109 RepID=UPI000404A8BF|nr:hemolysin family protein [Desulfovibrio inopinatus]